MDATKWEKLAFIFRYILIVFDPQLEEAIKIDQGDSSTFMGSGFALGIASEASRRHEDANIVIAKHGKECA